MTYATTTDVETELGRPASSPAQTDQWQAWLERVERRISARFTAAGLDLAAQVTAGTPTAQDVADVEVAAVLRRIDSAGVPAGLTSITTSVDDGTVTRRRESASGSSPLDLTFEEWALLLPSTATGAFSTRPGFEPDATFPPPLGLNWS